MHNGLGSFVIYRFHFLQLTIEMEQAFLSRLFSCTYRSENLVVEHKINGPYISLQWLMETHGMGCHGTDGSSDGTEERENSSINLCSEGVNLK